MITILLIVYFGIALSVAGLVFATDPNGGSVKTAIKEGILWPKNLF